MDDVLIIGAGIGGLALSLALERRRIPCRVYESAPEIKAVGVGINLLPHATQVLDALGVLPALQKVAVETQEAAFFNRFGQLIYREPLGRRGPRERGREERRGQREVQPSHESRRPTLIVSPSHIHAFQPARAPSSLRPWRSASARRTR